MRILAVLILLIGLPGAGWANRVALVIGNSQYTAVAPLDNPQNDSIAITRALKAQGFEVTTADNLGRTEMRDTLRQFRARADQADIALVYYAGHGIEIGGINYLVPVDARLDDERDAGLEMITVDLVLRQISGARALKMVVLDACRNNPFVAKMQRQGATRAVSQGLGDIRTTEADTLIAYAAAAGGITPDGLPGENSPFTAAFLKALNGPPTDVRRMLGRARDQMRLSVPGAAPFVYSSLGGGEYVINPRSAGPTSTAPAAETPTVQVTPDAQTNGRSISVDFVRIDRDGTVIDWDEFLIRYERQSTHPLYAFALEKRATLQAAASVASVASVAPSQAATQSAALGATRSGQASAALPSRVAVPTMTLKQAARSLQTELQKRSCYAGRIDGIFGRNSRRGLKEFARQAGVSVSLPASPDVGQIWEVRETVSAFPDIRCPRIARRAAPSKPRKQTPKAHAPAAVPAPAPAPVVVPVDAPEKKSTGPIFSNRPCPVAMELRMNRPECH